MERLFGLLRANRTAAIAGAVVAVIGLAGAAVTGDADSRRMRGR
jgi:hypothetical protein